MNYPAIPREFFNGDCFDAYRILGAHPCSDNGTEGWRFAVWAPGATAVEVCGGFDGWEAGVPMEKADTGVWSAFVPGLAEGDLYKYRVHGADGVVSEAELRDAALAVANKIAEKSPDMVRIAKEALQGIEDGNLEDKYRWEQGFTLQAYMSKESLEARKAFVEKRDAKF